MRRFFPPVKSPLRIATLFAAVMTVVALYYFRQFDEQRKKVMKLEDDIRRLHSDSKSKTRKIDSLDAVLRREDR